MRNSRCIGVIKTNGTGATQVEPDTAVISLGVATENTSLETAQQENAKTTVAVINALLGSGIPKRQIQTSSYSIEPQYDYVEGKQVFRGYKVTNILTIKLKDLSMAGEVIDRAVAGGANIVYGVTFTVESPAMYYRRALELAVKDAAAKAAKITSSMGASINEIPYRIIEGSTVTPMPESLVLKSAAAATPILPGQIVLTARIEAYFTYWR